MVLGAASDGWLWWDWVTRHVSSSPVTLSLVDSLREHASLTVLSVVIAQLISLPLAVAASRRRSLENGLLSVLGVAYTIPDGPVKGLEIGAYYSGNNAKSRFYTDLTGHDTHGVAGRGARAVGLIALVVDTAVVLAATIVAILALVNVPSFLAAYRKDGVLRRLAVRLHGVPGAAVLRRVPVGPPVGAGEPHGIRSHEQE